MKYKQEHEFHDWSRGRSLAMPPRRRPVRGLVFAIAFLVLIAFLWWAGHEVAQAYRVVFGS
jgi:hypothetical protein